MNYEIIDRERQGGKISLGDQVSIGRGVSIDISADVTIGDNVAISEEVLILTHDHSPEDISKKYSSSLIIEDNVWIGARVIVLASCSIIGNSSVIGAGSVLTKDVPSKELWAGNPAKFIRGL